VQAWWGDVVVHTEPGDGERLIGFFYSYRPTPFLELAADLVYTEQFIGFTVYNRAEQCQFCPVRKVQTMGMRILELTPSLKLRVFEIEKLRVMIYGGLSTQVRLDFAPSEDVSFGNKHPGVAEVCNQIGDAFTPLVAYLTYGVALQYNRFFLLARIQDFMGQNFAKDLHLNDQNYPFNVSNRNLTLSAGYHFYSLRSKKKKAKG